MKDYNKYMKMAYEFNTEGKAFVHAEYRGENKNELIISGDPVALLRTAQQILERVSLLSGLPFEHGVEAVKELHQLDNEPSNLAS